MKALKDQMKADKEEYETEIKMLQEDKIRLEAEIEYLKEDQGSKEVKQKAGRSTLEDMRREVRRSLNDNRYKVSEYFRQIKKDIERR